MRPQPPARNQHVSGAPAGAGGLALGKELREIIRSVIAQKRWLIANRGHEPEDLKIGVLQQWLDRNPFPSVPTVKNLPHQLRQYVEDLMPARNVRERERFRQLFF